MVIRAVAVDVKAVTASVLATEDRGVVDGLKVLVGWLVWLEVTVVTFSGLKSEVSTGPQVSLQSMAWESECGWQCTVPRQHSERRAPFLLSSALRLRPSVQGRDRRPAGWQQPPGGSEYLPVQWSSVPVCCPTKN